MPLHFKPIANAKEQESIIKQIKQSLDSGKHQHSSPEVPEQIPQCLRVMFSIMSHHESAPENRVTDDVLFCFFLKHLNVFLRNQSNLDHMPWAWRIFIS